MDQAFVRRENEGGSPLLSALEFTSKPLLGTAAQIEWAEAIRGRVNDEFDRVATSFRSIAQHQEAPRRSATEAIITILEDKRAEVLSRETAGYFIRNWQDISDQVRKMIGQDSRYQAMKADKATDNSFSGDR